MAEILFIFGVIMEDQVQKNMEMKWKLGNRQGFIVRMPWDSLRGWGLCQESGFRVLNVKVKRGLCSFPCCEVQGQRLAQKNVQDAPTWVMFVSCML